MRQSLVVGLALAGLTLATCGAGEQHPGPARVVSQMTWTMPDSEFGGWSGIEVTPDGSGFIALSDRAVLIEGRFVRDGGRITAIQPGRMVALKGAEEDRLPRYGGDSEGLAIGPDGTLHISFEGLHRVWRYDGIGSNATDLPRHPDFETMQSNSSLEALAIGPDGALYTLPERSGDHDRPFSVYRYQDGEWDQPFSIPRRGLYLPVGADIGPDGRFYLLERNFGGPRGLFGFSTRIRRFDMAGDGLSGETTLYESRLRTLGNLEGISVWRDARGVIRLTAIADDNFNPFQSTEVVEFTIEE